MGRRLYELISQLEELIQSIKKPNETSSTRSTEGNMTSRRSRSSGQHCNITWLLKMVRLKNGELEMLKNIFGIQIEIMFLCHKMQNLSRSSSQEIRDYYSSLFHDCVGKKSEDILLEKSQKFSKSKKKLNYGSVREH